MDYTQIQKRFLANNSNAIRKKLQCYPLMTCITTVIIGLSVSTQTDQVNQNRLYSHSTLLLPHLRHSVLVGENCWHHTDWNRKNNAYQNILRNASKVKAHASSLQSFCVLVVQIFLQFCYMVHVIHTVITQAALHLWIHPHWLSTNTLNTQKVACTEL